jgi:hypothetical protein
VIAAGLFFAMSPACTGDWANRRKRSIGVTFAAIDEGAHSAVIGASSLPPQVCRATFLKKYVRRLPQYGLPLILLARLR